MKPSSLQANGYRWIFTNDSLNPSFWYLSTGLDIEIDGKDEKDQCRLVEKGKNLEILVVDLIALIFDGFGCERIELIR